MKYTVYKHVFPNNKVYIGITSLKPEHRWGNGGRGYLHKTNNKYNQPFIAYAILKYGWENIKHEIICKGLSKEDAEKMEIELITKYKSNDRRFGYNVENGGNSIGKISDETKRKIGASCKGERHYNYGKHQPEEVRKKISDSKNGRCMSEEAKRKLGKQVYCVETKKTYYSISYAAMETGIKVSSISKACKGVLKSAGGYHWKYLEREE